jgi:hypothetical protein
MQACTTIDGVIAALDAIIGEAVAQNNRIGYFTSLYRRVTLQVKEGIESGWFQDGPRMEQLDVVFANRFLDAWEQVKSGKQPTESWQVAFDGLNESSLLILQQLMLGMNAHINLDLGIAAAQVAPGNALPGLKQDFMTINGILASLIAGVEKELSGLSPLLRSLLNIAPTDEKRIFNFSLDIARSAAWKFAEELAPVDAGAQDRVIAARDAKVAGFGKDLRDPSWLLGSAIQVIRLAESSNIPKIIETLATISPTVNPNEWQTITLRRSKPPRPAQSNPPDGEG